MAQQIAQTAMAFEKQRLGRKLQRVSNKFVQEMGRRPTLEEAAKAAYLTNDETRRLLKIRRRTVSLDRPLGRKHNSYSGDLSARDSAEPPLSAAARDILKDKLERVLDILTFREKEIIKLRYGLEDGHILTFETLGRKFKITRERVRQIQLKAMCKLMKPIRSRAFEAFLD
jgi:RNA polymerase primary sigma factor